MEHSTEKTRALTNAVKALTQTSKQADWSEWCLTESESNHKKVHCCLILGSERAFGPGNVQPNKRIAFNPFSKGPKDRPSFNHHPTTMLLPGHVQNPSRNSVWQSVV